VLASDLVAFRTVLDEGRLGVLVPVGDSGALATATLDLLAAPDRRRDLAAAAKVAVRRYDWSIVADEVIAVYEMAVAAGTGHRQGRYRLSGR
jgi:phosphatidylinositol alpha-mannosyltransferase